MCRDVPKHARCMCTVFNIAELNANKKARLHGLIDNIELVRILGLVEAGGFEPPSASPLPKVLHA